MARKASVLIGVLVGVLVGTACLAADKADLNDQMRKKLEYSTNILAGLSSEDFDQILRNAKALNELGERRWRENQSIDYRTQHQVFWFTNATLIMAAEERNIDGATLAFTQMTVSCVNCHKLLRSE